MIKYHIPKKWISYHITDIASELTEAKASIISLKSIPYQKAWVEVLQKMELKREVAGTSRIEGADFTERELDQAINETPEQLATRSQKQAHAAVNAYRWIVKIPHDQPITEQLIKDIHRRMISGADDDHCPPGAIRSRDENVHFGQPRHRGACGGDECQEAFTSFVEAIQKDFPTHDPLVQALAAHYHLAAMHPFLDGNGRTARALEALFLQRAGLRDTCFIAMSNYYYDEKIAYLTALSDVHAPDHNLTSFLKFALKGIATQSQRLLNQIKLEVSKALFLNLMYTLFNRLKNKRTRIIQERQIEILKILLEEDSLDYEVLAKRTKYIYEELSDPIKGIVRDVNALASLGAVKVTRKPDGRFDIKVRLEWPTEITETEFFAKIKALPKDKTHTFLQ